MFDGFLFLLFEYSCITQSTSLPHKKMQIPITSLGLIERGKDKACVSLRKNQVLIASDVSINMILSHFNTINMDLSVPSLQALLSPAKVRFLHTYSFTSCDAHLEINSVTSTQVVMLLFISREIERYDVLFPQSNPSPPTSSLATFPIPLSSFSVYERECLGGRQRVDATMEKPPKNLSSGYIHVRRLAQ